MSEKHNLDYDAMAKAFSQSLEELFKLPDGDSRKRFIDISRVPLICQSIVSISTRLTTIESNIAWGVKIVIGTVITGILALLFTK